MRKFRSRQNDEAERTWLRSPYDYDDVPTGATGLAALREWIGLCLLLLAGVCLFLVAVVIGKALQAAFWVWETFSRDKHKGDEAP